MSIRFSCDCGQEIEVDDELAGKPGSCPACEAVLEVPALIEVAPILQACVHCDQQIQGTAQRCRFCGADQHSEGPPRAEPPAMPLPEDLTRQPEAEQKAMISLVLGVLSCAVPCGA